MPSPTPVMFDGASLRIIVQPGYLELDLKRDIYSEWKIWAQQSDNLKFPQAFRSVGGDPISATQNVSAFIFLLNENGWRIRPDERDHNLNIIGNLYPNDDTVDDGTMIVPTTGAFTVLVNIDRDASSVVETVTTPTSGLTPDESQDLEDIRKFLTNEQLTIPGLGIQQVLDDDDISVFKEADIFEDAAGSTRYQRRGIERRGRFKDPSSPS